MSHQIKQTLNLIAQTIFDKKGFNILGLDVRGLSTITDYILIAEGSVDRHVIAIGQALVETLKGKDIYPLHTEGFKTGDWVVIDLLDIIIHIFMPGIREKYHLEELWKKGEVLDLQIDTSPLT